MIENNIIEEIRNKADIVTVVSDYLALKKRGKNFLASCPFHSEKTPSFTVSQEKQLFHCFGCGEGGNVFSFLMKIENIPFVESVKLLADKLGMPFELSEKQKSFQDTGNSKLFEIIASTMRFYESCLPKSGAATDYIKKRGLDKSAVSAFKIGYAPEGWDNTYRHLLSNGFIPKDIEKAGLIIPREGTSSFYDRFRNRLMFPVFDAKGMPLGFGARSLDQSEPKYLNSPDSSVYNKGNILYGLNLSRDEIKSSNAALVVEGYMDMIACFSAGFKNTAATLGTALTINHAKLLKRFSDNIILVFDSDAAGLAAAERSIELLSNIGIYPKIAPLSGGKDPDEIIKKEGKDKFAQLISNCLPWMKYKLKRVLGRHNLAEAEGKAKAAKEAATVLAKEKDSIIQGEYIKFVSGCLNIDAESVLSEVKKASYYGRTSPINLPGRQAGNRMELKKPPSKIENAEKTVIKLAVDDEASRAVILRELKPDDFTDADKKDVFEKISGTGLLSGESSFLSAITDNLSGDEAKKMFSKIMLEDGEFIDKERVLSDCISVIKANQLKNHIESLRHKLKEAEKNGNQEAMEELQSEYKKCHEQMRTL